MGGGKVEQNSQANGKVAFNPVVMGGGSVMVGGNVGNAGVTTVHDGQATGSSTSIGVSMSMPGMPLMNLDNDNIYLQNLAFGNFNSGYTDHHESIRKSADSNSHGSSSQSSHSHGSGHKSQTSTTTNTYTPPTAAEIAHYKQMVEDAGGLDAIAAQQPELLDKVGGYDAAKKYMESALMNLDGRTAIVTTPETAMALINLKKLDRNLAYPFYFF